MGKPTGSPPQALINAVTLHPKPSKPQRDLAPMFETTPPPDRNLESFKTQRPRKALGSEALKTQVPSRLPVLPLCRLCLFGASGFDFG